MGLPQLAFASRGPAHPTSPSNGSITICRSPNEKRSDCCLQPDPSVYCTKLDLAEPCPKQVNSKLPTVWVRYLPVSANSLYSRNRPGSTLVYWIPTMGCASRSRQSDPGPRSSRPRLEDAGNDWRGTSVFADAPPAVYHRGRDARGPRDDPTRSFPSRRGEEQSPHKRDCLLRETHPPQCLSAALSAKT